MRWKLGWLLALAALLLVGGCSEPEDTALVNPCDQTVTVLVGSGPAPVVTIPAGATVPGGDFGAVVALSSGETAKLEYAEADDGVWRGVVPSSACADASGPLAVVVVDKPGSSNAAEIIEIRVHSTQAATWLAGETIGRALAHLDPVISVGPDTTAARFVPRGSSDWDGKETLVDVTAGIEAVTKHFPGATFALDCSAFGCRSLDFDADGGVDTPVEVSARLPGTVTDSETFGAIMGALFLLAAGVGIGLVVRNARRAKARRAARLAELPPPPWASRVDSGPR